MTIGRTSRRWSTCMLASSLLSSMHATSASAVSHAAAVSAPASRPSASLPTLPIDTLPRNATTHLNFVVLGVADPQRALAFYTQVLGMRERGRAQPDLKHYEIIVGFDDRPLTAGISLKYRNGPPQPQGNGSSALNLVVADLESKVAKVEALGGKVTSAYARHDSPTMSYGYATIRDPDGNAIELVEYRRLPAAR